MAWVGDLEVWQERYEHKVVFYSKISLFRVLGRALGAWQGAFMDLGVGSQVLF